MTSEGQKRLNITFIGAEGGNSGLRARALERLGHRVRIIDPYCFAHRYGWCAKWCFHTGALGLGKILDWYIRRLATSSTTDLFIVNQGEYLGGAAVAKLGEMAPIVNYMNDDPFGGGGGVRLMGRWGGFRFRRFLSAVPHYDLICVVREVNVNEAYKFGARNVCRVYMSSDEIMDQPREVSTEDQQRFGCKVSFVGNWMPERGGFLAELAAAGVPLSIWGGGWKKAPEWFFLKNYWRGPALSRRDYSIALRCADVNLGLLSKANRDLHTRRSVEIPAVGGVLCAERTTEHEALYLDRVEAVFWRNAEECATLCHELLEKPEWRRQISVAARKRSLANNLFNEAVMRQIIRCVMGN